MFDLSDGLKEEESIGIRKSPLTPLCLPAAGSCQRRGGKGGWGREVGLSYFEIGTSFGSFSSRSFSSFSISQMEITGKNFEKRTMAKMNPAESPAIMDHSTHEGI
jgi:hypothetical protein